MQNAINYQDFFQFSFFVPVAKFNTFPKESMVAQLHDEECIPISFVTDRDCPFFQSVLAQFPPEQRPYIDMVALGVYYPYNFYTA